MTPKFNYQYPCDRIGCDNLIKREKAKQFSQKIYCKDCIREIVEKKNIGEERKNIKEEDDFLKEQKSIHEALNEEEEINEIDDEEEDGLINVDDDDKEEIDEDEFEEDSKTLEPIEEPKLTYKFGLFEITKDNLNKFISPENRRRISNSQVKSLKQAILNGKHFDSPIVVNEVSGLYRVVDGNHRIEAIIEIITKYEDFKINILLIKYSKLDVDGEIEAFRIWNVGKVQSLDDFIKSIEKKIEFLEWIKKDFPVKVTIYKQNDSISVKNLFNGLIASIKNLETGYGLRRQKFREDIKELKKEHYEFAKTYMENFIDVFGKPEIQNSSYYRTTFFTACMIVCYNCKKDLTESLRKEVLSDKEVLEFSKFGGRTANKKMINILRKKLGLE